jgi:hypothetical protein
MITALTRMDRRGRERRPIEGEGLLWFRTLFMSLLSSCFNGPSGMVIKEKTPAGVWRGEFIAGTENARLPRAAATLTLGRS